MSRVSDLLCKQQLDTIVVFPVGIMVQGDGEL